MRLRGDEIQGFYEDCYQPTADAGKYGLWRELGARGKADHVVALVAEAGIAPPASVAEIGCGEGAVLAELARRGVGERHVGYEISASAVELAARRPEIDAAHIYDGAHLEVPDGEYDLAFATHVLEHVPDPAPLAAELLRVARTVVIEVPLEANLFARRPAAQRASERVGHLHAFDRAAVRGLVTAAGGRVLAELADPLPREVHTFGAEGAAAHAKGEAKWALRAGLSALPGGVAERLFTLHYALLATR